MGIGSVVYYIAFYLSVPTTYLPSSLSLSLSVCLSLSLSLILSLSYSFSISFSPFTSIYVYYSSQPFSLLLHYSSCSPLISPFSRFPPLPPLLPALFPSHLFSVTSPPHFSLSLVVNSQRRKLFGCYSPYRANYHGDGETQRASPHRRSSR